MPSSSLDTPFAPPTVPLISAAQLQSADKILFIAHLALGDFTYLHNDLLAFAQAYPHLRIDLWVDEVRRTNDAQQWPFLKKYVLYDWLAECSFIKRVYNETYSPALYEESVASARAERYPLIVSLATLRPWQYARLARRIAASEEADSTAASTAPTVIGMWPRASWRTWLHAPARRLLNGALVPHRSGSEWAVGPHISDHYADWFRQLTGMDIPAAARMPVLTVPDIWRERAAAQLMEWGFQDGPLIMINPYAKTRKRCWPLTHVVALIQRMQADQRFQKARFIVNAVPQELPQARAALDQAGLVGCQLFSATDNFFQLPAMLERCDLIISVETAVMHLANAVRVPVIALMRQKNPEWVPLDHAHSVVITAARRRDWVDAIPVEALWPALDQISLRKQHD
jgi:heptosyltransferase-3